MQRPCVLVACLILGLSGTALGTPYAGEFLSTGIGARPLGMGGAYVALVDDASASYWNPAALPRSEQRQAIYMHSERFGDLVNYDAAAIVLRPRQSESGARSALGIGFVMVSVPNIQFTPTDPDQLAQIEECVSPSEGCDDSTVGNGRLDPGERINFDFLDLYATEETSRELAIYLSYGRSRVLMENMSAGGSVKFVRKSVGDYSAFGIGLDLGALYEAMPGLMLGVNLQDITTTFLEWNGAVDDLAATLAAPTSSEQTSSAGREYITPTVKLGGAYTRDIPALAGRVTGALDLDLRFEDEQGVNATTFGSDFNGTLRAGMEYWYRDALALRVGSERIGTDGGRFTAGAGLRVNRLAFDYAYRDHSELDDTHRVSGGVSF